MGKKTEAHVNDNLLTLTSLASGGASGGEQSFLLLCAAPHCLVLQAPTHYHLRYVSEGLKL